MIHGRATSQGTAAYKARFENRLEGHFRERGGLWFSSIGMGSYLGEPDEETDKLYETALKEALLSGINVVDSAINYRAQRSERSFGKALAELVKKGEVRREEIILCTKGGFIPFDGEEPSDPAEYFQTTYVEPGILKPEDVAQGCHAMTPPYLTDQLERSLNNLGVETIDIYYLHNPETQLAECDRQEFVKRIRKAFEFLEEKAVDGKIGMYGTATWNGYRVPLGHQDYLSLEELVIAAREVGGPGHHFRALQLPFNLAMPEAWVLANQSLGGHVAPLLEVAQRLGVIVIGSASLLQARLAGRLPEHFTQHLPHLQTSAQRSLQFARSVAGLTTSLVGMKHPSHVQENLETAKCLPLRPDELFQLFQHTE